MRNLFSGVCVFFLLLGAALPQECKKTEYTSDQQTYMDTAVQKFAACEPKSDAACRGFLAQAVEQVYGVKDFGSNSQYMAAREVADKVGNDASWEHLGNAADQNTLKNAQSGANCGRAVLAVLKSDTGGHVALVLPGQLVRSGMWNLDVPKSASFFMHNPQKSYAGKALSYAFPSPKDIEIYARKN